MALFGRIEGTNQPPLSRSDYGKCTKLNLLRKKSAQSKGEADCFTSANELGLQTQWSLESLNGSSDVLVNLRMLGNRFSSEKKAFVCEAYHAQHMIVRGGHAEEHHFWI